jgi:molybdopterin-guanine dinucleotide biosynthesis protein A
MIAAILFGRKGSVGFPGKNLYPVLGRPLCEYPLLAAVNSKKIDKIFVSTDDDEIIKMGEKYGAEMIERPDHLANSTVLVDEVFAHAHQEVKKRYSNVEMIVILVCNAPNILSSVIDQGIEKLISDPGLDSAVGVSDYTTYTPIRARTEDSDGLLKPFVPFEVFGDPNKINCDRDSMGSVWVVDMTVSVVRPKCLENLDKGMLPQKWLGQKIFPLKNWGGLDADFEWQVPQLEFWLKANGFSEKQTPYD